MEVSYLDEIKEQFKAKTKKSYAFAQEAQEVMPGGVTANIKYFDPYPIIMERGEGDWCT
ncbi:hypothetical protein [Cytobacillus purgationiresistens]|uniref:Glutamate-1-semialdehyde aminotransferase n=1 Tax=Cytobacillus purgationiresistens TaxID=863449 RepID=A0ABU0AAI1_9BACI|nr:hypothetical protein [Cytobacillus purgationiresistens]MDQ0268253.1 glutamate-1-semialdehyde aminotransferase [Cytobacillus purgationiresistens]